MEMGKNNFLILIYNDIKNNNFYIVFMNLTEKHVINKSDKR